MSDTEQIYEFQLVEFVKRGPKTGIRDVDCVPSKWITFNHSKGKPETKFMPPPYNEQSNELLHSLIIAKAPPLQSWPSYTVMLRGHAKTYQEAERRVETLRSESFAYTTDNDILPEDKAAQITNKFRAKRLHVRKETQAALNVSRIGESEKESDEFMEIETKKSSSESDGSSYYQSSESEWDDVASKPCCENKKMSQITQKGRKRKSSTFQPKIKSSDSSKGYGTLNIKTTTQPLKAGEQASGSGILNFKTATKTGEGKNEKHPDKSKIKKQKSTNDGDFQLLMTLMKGLSVDIKEVLSNQRVILSILHESHGITDNKQDFITKHNLMVPFKSEAEFHSFNDILKNDEKYRKEFTASLHSLLDREGLVNKTLTNILRKYMARDVALKFTTSRQMPGKTVIRETIFFDCILGVVSDTHIDHLTKVPLKEKDFCTAFGRVLANAKDWEGHRQLRLLTQNKEDQENIETTE